MCIYSIQFGRMEGNMPMEDNNMFPMEFPTGPGGMPMNMFPPDMPGGPMGMPFFNPNMPGVPPMGFDGGDFRGNGGNNQGRPNMRGGGHLNSRSSMPRNAGHGGSGGGNNQSSSSNWRNSSSSGRDRDSGSNRDSGRDNNRDSGRDSGRDRDESRDRGRDSGRDRGRGRDRDDSSDHRSDS